MEAQDSSDLLCHVGDGQISCGNGQQPFSFTWNPPTTPVADDVAEGNDRKRRRVQVDVDKQGTVVLKLGAEMTFDFKSTHADAEKKLVDVTAERDQLKANVETLETELVQRDEVIQTYKDGVVTKERDELKNNLKKTTAKLEYRESKLKDSQAKLKDSQKELRNSQDALDDREEDLDVAKHKLSVAEKERDRAKSQLRTTEEKVRELKNEIQTNKAAAAAAQDTAMKQLQGLQQEKKKVQDEMDELIRWKSIALERHTYLQVKLAASEKEQASLSGSLQRLQSAANCCEGCERLEEELKEALEMQDKTSAELRKLQQEAATRESRVFHYAHGSIG